MEIRKISYEDQQPGVPAVLPQPHSNIPCHAPPRISVSKNAIICNIRTNYLGMPMLPSQRTLYAWIFDFLCIHALHIPF